MEIKDIMSDNPNHLEPNLSITEAAKKISTLGFDAYPIMENGNIVGMITIQDIVMRAVAKSMDMTNTKVRDVMTKQVFTCSENDSLEEVAKVMAEHDVNGVPVMNNEKRLVGFVSLDDFIHKGKDEKIWHELTRSLHRATI